MALRRLSNDQRSTSLGSPVLPLRRLSNENRSCSSSTSSGGTPVPLCHVPDIPRPRPRNRTSSGSNGILRDLSDGLSSPRGSSSCRSLSENCPSPWWPKIALAALMGITFVSGGYMKHVEMSKEIKSMHKDRTELVSQKRRLMHDLNEALRTIDADTHGDAVVKALRKEKRILERQLQEEKVHAQTKLQLEKEMKQAHDHNKRMQQRVQALSKEHAIEHYGSGPHYVEFEISMTLQNGKHTTRFFTVELAPLDYMPTTVDLFLEQVHRGLWENSSFHWNAKHVMMADPDHKVHFVKAGVEHVPFQEYNERYPHEQYTLGFTGEPAGPMFYINKMDNTAIHGPGETQTAEPCFGKIIIGTGTVDLMSKQPSPEHHPDGFVHPPKIVAMRIMNLEDVHGGLDYLHSHTQPTR